MAKRVGKNKKIKGKNRKQAGYRLRSEESK